MASQYIRTRVRFDQLGYAEQARVLDALIRVTYAEGREVATASRYSTSSCRYYAGMMRAFAHLAHADAIRAFILGDAIYIDHEYRKGGPEGRGGFLLKGLKEEVPA